MIAVGPVTRFCSFWGLLVLLGLGVLAARPGWAQTPLAPGQSLPPVDAALRTLDGRAVAPRALLGEEGTVLLFWSNDCPWVARYRSRVERLAAQFEGRGVRVVLVNANDTTGAPEESLAASRAHAQDPGYPARYVRDPEAALARAVGATRTPQAFVLDADRRLVYVGAIDDSPSSPDRVEASYLRRALEGLVAGRDAAPGRQKAFGCALRYPE